MPLCAGCSEVTGYTLTSTATVHIGILPSPLTGRVTLGTIFNHSVLQFPHL